MLNALAQGGEIAVSLILVFGYPVRRIYRWLRDDHKALEILQLQHNYPHLPPPGHYYLQPLREEQSRAHPSR